MSCKSGRKLHGSHWGGQERVREEKEKRGIKEVIRKGVGGKKKCDQSSS